MLGKPMIVLSVSDGPLGSNKAALEPVSNEWTTGDLEKWVTAIMGAVLKNPKLEGHYLSFIDLFQAVVVEAESSSVVIIHPFTFGLIHDWMLEATQRRNYAQRDKETPLKHKE